ncbi:MAG: hypothetical protein ACTSQW_00885 [Promethearchaeota archaeon]
MTNVSSEEFLLKLFNVVYKLYGIAKTQSDRLKKEWDENFASLEEQPHLVRSIRAEKEKFLTDINYRIKVLNTITLSFEDGFHSIKSILTAFYKAYFKDSDIFTQNFNKEDQNNLKYLVAKEILGNLFQYNQLDHETVPLKYNILARNHLLMKFKEQSATSINNNVKKVKIELKLQELRKKLNEIIADGFFKKTKVGKNTYYSLHHETELSEKGKIAYNQLLRPLVDWSTLFYRSYYNVREINVTVNGDVKYPEFLNKVLLKAATQGYVACHYVFKNLVKYYTKLKDEQ